jgi:hypothetical protein
VARRIVLVFSVPAVAPLQAERLADSKAAFILEHDSEEQIGIPARLELGEKHAEFFYFEWFLVPFISCSKRRRILKLGQNLVSGCRDGIFEPRDCLRGVLEEQRERVQVRLAGSDVAPRLCDE